MRKKLGGLPSLLLAHRRGRHRYPRERPGPEAQPHPRTLRWMGPRVIHQGRFGHASWRVLYAL